MIGFSDMGPVINYGEGQLRGGRWRGGEKFYSLERGGGQNVSQAELREGAQKALR